MNQYGIIINIFGAPVKAAASNPLMALLTGLISILTAAGVAMFVIPTLLVATAFLLALAQVLVWCAAILGGVSLGIGLVVGSHNALKAALLNRETVAMWGQQLNAHNHAARRNAIAESRERLQLNPRVFVAGERVTAIESKEPVLR